MENPSKNNSQKKVTEPETVYKSKSEIDNEDEMHPVLRKLLEKSIKQHEQGLVYTHEEAMQIIKDKYPFFK